MQNTTHTVIVKQQNRGFAFLVGIVTIFLLFRWWLTGSLFSAIDFGFRSAQGESEGLGSVTGVVLPIAVDIAIAIGGLMVAVFSGLWYTVFDLASGLFEYFQTMRATSSATKTAINQATGAAGSAAGVTSVVAAVESAMESSPIEKLSQDDRIKADVKTIARRLQDAEATIAKLNNEVFPPPPAPPKEPTVAELMEEIQALKTAAAAAPASSKTTRSAKSTNGGEQ